MKKTFLILFLITILSSCGLSSCGGFKSKTYEENETQQRNGKIDERTK